MKNSNSIEIVIQNLQMQISTGKKSYREELMVNEIADLKVEHIAFTGPNQQTVQLEEENVSIFLFLKGNGTLHTGSLTQSLSPESIAIPSNEFEQVQFEISEGEELHFLKFTKKLSTKDFEDIKNFPEENRYQLFFTQFEECEPYTEKIKSPNTISRTVLPANIVPRVSLGTVEATGPDKVGAHKHPMLEQFFLGLSNNDITVYADDVFTEMKQYSLLHIPLGSTHWVNVEANKKMNYMWMDFFSTKDGEEWLKTHKPINNEPT